MASLKVIVFVACVVTCFFVSTNSKPAITIDEVMFLEGNVQIGGLAEQTIDDVIAKLLENTASHGYNYEWIEALGADHFWGNAACNGVISVGDCRLYLNIAKDYLHQQCSFTPGGHINLHDCRMRFEPYEFHGNW